MYLRLRSRPHVSRYFLICDFFFPDTASVHPHPANSTANTDIFKSTFKSGKNKSATNPIMCGWVNPDIFESDDVAKSCPISYQTINQYGGTTCKFGATITRSMAHALKTFYCRGALGARVNPDTIGCMWTENATTISPVILACSGSRSVGTIGDPSRRSPVTRFFVICSHDREQATIILNFYLRKYRQGNTIIIMRSSFSKSFVFKMSALKFKTCVTKFLGFEERFRKVVFVTD